MFMLCGNGFADDEQGLVLRDLRRVLIGGERCQAGLQVVDDARLGRRFDGGRIHELLVC